MAADAADTATERLPTCPAWCTAEHDDWERAEPGRATHRHVAGRVKASCHPDMGHGVTVALLLDDPRPWRDGQPEPRIMISHYCSYRDDPYGIDSVAIIPAAQAPGLATVLTAMRKTDPLAKLLRAAAELLEEETSDD